jgi:hypothetical protein
MIDSSQDLQMLKFVIESFSRNSCQVSSCSAALLGNHASISPFSICRSPVEGSVVNQVQSINEYRAHNMRNLIRMLLKIVILVAPNFHSVSTLALLPKRKVANVQKQNFNKNIQVSTKDDNAVNSLSIKAPDRDEMISRAAVLRQSILKQQLELQQLERQIVCCSSKASYSSPSTGIYSSPIDYIIQTSEQARLTFMSSFDALNRKILRVKQKQGKRNKKYKNVEEYIVSQTLTSGRILSDLARNPDRLLHLADPNTPSLVPHLPAIYARMDQLEPHVKPILEKVLNNREHLKSIEPYLGQVLERFDDIEPHFPWILKM